MHSAHTCSTEGTRMLRSTNLFPYLFLRIVAVPVGEISNTVEPDLSVSSMPSTGIAEIELEEARPPVPWHQATRLDIRRFSRGCRENFGN